MFSNLFICIRSYTLPGSHNIKVIYGKQTDYTVFVICKEADDTESFCIDIQITIPTWLYIYSSLRAECCCVRPFVVINNLALK